MSEETDAGPEKFETPEGMERRAIPVEVAEMRLHESGGSGPGTLDGYAAVFDSRSVVLPGPGGRTFREIIKPGAFDGVMADERRDVLAARNHDPDNLLGRESNGTLSLEVDERGMRYSVQLPDTTVGRDTAALVERQDIQGSSFTFRVPEGGDDWRREDGQWIREVRTVAEVGDVGPVTSEAYKETVVSARTERRAAEVMGVEPDPPEERQSRPTFEDTEDTEPEWSEGRWGRPPLAVHAEASTEDQWADLEEDARAAIAGRFIVGAADVETYSDLGNPVVNPATDNLNRWGVLAARQRPVSDEAKAVADTLWEEHFAGEEEEAGERALVVEGRLTGRESRQTDQDLRDRIGLALQERFGGEGVFVWIEATFLSEGRLVYRLERESGESGLFRIDFEVSGDGSVSLGGEPVEVVRVTTYEPVQSEPEGGEERDEKLERARRLQRQREAELRLAGKR